MRFVKGHGTENDFVVVPDPGGELRLRPALVARLCDRRAGIGADGVLRVVRSEAEPDAAGQAGVAEWFMDYRNADGGLAEMCGNGIRVFARYLVDAGLAAPGTLMIGTRSGPRRVEIAAAGPVTVDMGPVRLLGPGEVRLAGRRHAGIRVDVGNPHLACRVDEPVGALDLGSAAPVLDPADFPAGGNVELIRVLEGDRIEMRVYERGSGETRSCGTGAVAAAAAAAHLAGRAGGTWEVAVPGGTLTVILGTGTGSSSGVGSGSARLRGPAVLVAEGELYPSWPPP